ncbi:MAG TPA: glucose-1-phosphate adenylyltransferase [Bacilli bacterium]|nr:glucose-1-phosphate adenylyltransferase [Bacilli bacterium]HPS19039.1 glucose-1-phosphate adenylyltransferase [Bacilli bacterium]
MPYKIVAMILAGGKGTRLESLTKKIAKPAVSFAAKYRIIDFPLSNCANSGINNVGVLMQYEALALDSYVSNGEKWGLNGVHSFMATLTPRQTEDSAKWYKGTADAITQNIDFLDAQNPDYVLILSGDHIYKTLYNEMIDLHVSSAADATISVIEVDPSEASRFGIMAVNKNDVITEFQEKPKVPKSNLASMGIYVFTWKTLRSYLKEDEKNDESDHDFGKNIIPTMLATGKKLQAFRFQGYWKDVGTLVSLHQANMDIALDRRELDLFDGDDLTKIYSEDTHSVPQYVGTKGSIKRSIANQGAIILGSVDSCVVSNEVVIEEGAICTRCVIMAGARIKKGTKINNAIVAPDTVVGGKQEINLGKPDVVLVSGGSYK